MERRKLRLGMVGGGDGALIGSVHRLAARMDDRYELVAGCFSSTPERAKQSAARLGIATERSYDTFLEMAECERRRPDGIEVVVIATPNHLHLPVARCFLEAGIHVLCDKPMTTTVAGAVELVRLVQQSGLIFVLTHNYTSLPMVREARAIATSGALGKLRLVHVEYPQEWLSTPLEQNGQKQSLWRTNPEHSGVGGAVADVGTHAINLACFVTGLVLREVAADVNTFVEGRRVDDNVHVLLRFHGGATGMLWASQVAAGTTNDIKLRVFGEKAGLEWSQQNATQLRVTALGEASSTFARGRAAGAAAARLARVPNGCPDGFLEGFANLYNDAAELIWARREGRAPDPGAALLPTVRDGLDGMRFIEAVIDSGRRNGVWVNILGG